MYLALQPTSGNEAKQWFILCHMANLANRMHSLFNVVFQRVFLWQYSPWTPHCGLKYLKLFFLTRKDRLYF